MKRNLATAFEFLCDQSLSALAWRFVIALFFIGVAQTGWHAKVLSEMQFGGTIVVLSALTILPALAMDTYREWRQPGYRQTFSNCNRRPEL